MLLYICNVPDIWNSALWACFCLWGANGPQTVRIKKHVLVKGMQWHYCDGTKLDDNHASGKNGLPQGLAHIKSHSA